MRYGIFSDIHSNLEALGVVLEAYAKENIDKYICLGDIVGYAVDYAVCIQKVKELGAIVIAGNHDWAAVELVSLEYFNPVAKEAIAWTKDKLSAEDKDFLAPLELVKEIDDFQIVHGTLDKPQDFNYMTDSYIATKTFDLMRKNICFIGHTHIPGVFIENDEYVTYSSRPDYKLDDNKKYIINVGSVGQPRDGNPDSSYCIFDTDINEIQIKRISYDIPKTQNKIIKAGLPLFLAQRLSQGR